MSLTACHSGSEYVPDPYLNADGSAYSGKLKPQDSRKTDVTFSQVPSMLYVSSEHIAWRHG